MRYGVALVAVVCGVAVAVQAQFVGNMQRQMGTLESTFFTYFSGGIVIGLIMLLARGGNLAAGRGMPWYAYTAGLLGLVIIGSLALSVGKLGLASSLVIVTASQFVTAAIISNFGLLGAEAIPIDLVKLSGMGLLAVGTYLVLR